MQRRDAVRRATRDHPISQRRACVLIGVDPKTVRRERPPDTPEIREEMHKIAEKRRRFGYRRIGIMLERKGMVMNEQKPYRIYREEGLSVRRGRGRKRARGSRTSIPVPLRPNQRWSLDFLSDTFGTCRKFRILTVNDDCYGGGQNLGVVGYDGGSGVKGTAMDVELIVETSFENGTKRTHRLGRLSRPYRHAQPEGFGLLLEDAKTILGHLQKAILLDQIEEISEAGRMCPDCTKAEPSMIIDPGFSTHYSAGSRVKAPRIRRCASDAKSGVVRGGPISPLARVFPDRSTPELQRLQAELGARHSFREAARILETFLPCAKQKHTSVRNRLSKIAKDISDSECTQPAISAAGAVAPALTVFWTALIFGAGRNTRNGTSMLWWARSRATTSAAASVLFNRRCRHRPASFARS